MHVSKKASPLDELLAINDDTLKTEFDRMSQLTAAERGDEPQAVDTLPCGSDDTDHGEFAVVLQSSSLTSTHVDNLTAENQDVVKDHQEKAVKLVSQLVRLIDGSLPDKEVLSQLRMSHVNKHNFDGSNGYLIMFYVVKSAAEDAKRPSNRKPAVRKMHLDRLMGLTLQGRSVDGEDHITSLGSHDAIMIMDAGRDGNATPLLSSVKIGDQAHPHQQCNVRETHAPCGASAFIAICIPQHLSSQVVTTRRLTPLTICYTEEAVMKNRQVNRGFQCLDQTEKCYSLIGPHALQLPQRENKHFKLGGASTAGTSLQGVCGPSDDCVWKMPVAQKKLHYGAEGRTTEHEESRDKYPVRNDDDMEPVNFWQMAPQVYEELLWRMNAKAVIDMTSNIDTLPVVCLEQGIMYVGITFNSQAVENLKRRLAVVVFQKFLDEASPLYKASLAKTIHDITTGESAISEPIPKAKAKAKAKTKAKAAAAAAAAAAAVAAGAGGLHVADADDEDGDEGDDCSGAEL